MMIGVKDVARLLSVSEKTIYRWISKKEIPVYKIGETYRFERVELMEWATSKKIKISYKIFEGENGQESKTVSLADAINTGGIYYHVAGHSKEDVLKSIVYIMNLPDDIDRDFLLEALIAREDLGTTAIGDGVAIPHVRNPIIYHIKKPVISLCFLEEPMDFCALDNKFVDTIFTIISSSIKLHLNILSKLSYALQNPDIRSIIKSTSGRQKIIDTISEFDKSINK